MSGDHAWFGALRCLGAAFAATAALLLFGPLSAADAAPSGTAIVVASANANSVLEFAPGASGNAAPVDVISGAQTGLSSPSFAAFDAAGDVVVTNAGNNSITKYVPGANGNFAPYATISGSNTGLNDPASVGFDASGNLYVLNAAGNTNSVTEYAPGANGNVAPIATISGSQTGLVNLQGNGAMVVDPAGHVWVAAGNSEAVLGFAPGAQGNVAPAVDITGSATRLAGVTGVALDPSGNVYASNVGSNTSPTSITEYAAGATGNVAPINMISGSNTGLNGPADVSVDPSIGDICVVNSGSSTVTEYSPGSNGNVAPTATIAGSATGLSNPQGVTNGSPILITQAPAPQSVVVGSNATFSAAAAGTPTPQQQWQVSTDGGSTYTDVPGANSTSLTLSGVTASQDGSLYRAVFTSSVGSASTAPAQLTVIGEPTITITTPTDGAHYTFGAVPNSNFACTAGAHASVASCTASIDGGAAFTSGAPLNGAVGPHTMTVSATDTPAGSATSLPVGYTVDKATPTITWANPADITYGTPLSATQLDATASVPGTFVYTPPAGTVLSGGAHQALSVTFTPTDTTDYNSASATVYINVVRVQTKLSALALVTIGPGLSIGQISAKLSRADNHAAISGETIAFSTYSGPLCSATTNSSGVATCTFSLTNAIRALLGLGYQANFAGDSNYAPSSATGGLLSLSIGTAAHADVLAITSLHGRTATIGHGTIRNHRLKLTLNHLHRGRYRVTLFELRAHHRAMVIAHNAINVR